MRILVAGDAMVDRYWHGECTRVSPEAPVPVVALGAAEEERQGGAANVARNIEAMGIEVAELYSSSYLSEPVVKLRIFARGQQVVRLDFDRRQAPLAPEAVEIAAEGCGIVVLSDYGKGSLALAPEIVRRCKAAGKRVLVDPRGRDAARYRGADVLKPNLAEMRELIGPWQSEPELDAGAQAMRYGAQIGAVLLTRGAGGMTLYNGAKVGFQAEARQVHDVSGAGDTALAALAAGLAYGMSLAEAALHANKAAGVAVTRFGTTVVGKWEVFA